MKVQVRWECPHGWLSDQAHFWNREELIATLNELASKLDHDTLQELFEDEMEADGYFTMSPWGQTEEAQDG